MAGTADTSTIQRERWVYRTALPSLWERYKDDDHARIASTQYLASGKETRISRVSMSASMAAIKLDPKERQESDGKDHTLEVLQVYRNIEL